MVLNKAQDMSSWCDTSLSTGKTLPLPQYQPKRLKNSMKKPQSGWLISASIQTQNLLTAGLHCLVRSHLMMNEMSI